ncbi:MAG: hypothetical protein AAF805_10070, partial [Planctomycetota bacterium]
MQVSAFFFLATFSYGDEGAALAAPAPHASPSRSNPQGPGDQNRSVAMRGRLVGPTDRRAPRPAAMNDPFTIVD